MATPYSKDNDLIYLAAEYQLVTHQHLVELTQRNPKSVWRSLPRLVDRGQLYCKPQGMYKPNVYSTFDIRRRENFSHDLMITQVHINLFKTGRLLEWNQPREKKKGELNEDARFELSVPTNEGQKRIVYYLEADTGTEPTWQLDDKFRRYFARRDERFVVLLIFPDEKRARTMARRAEKFLSSDKPSTWKFFLCTTLEEIKSDPLGPICHYSYSSEKCPIVPKMIK